MFAISYRPAAISLLLGGALLAGSVFAQEDELGWPREIDAPAAKIVVYQPQVDSFEKSNLTARAAVSVTQAGASEPVFGAVWLESSVSTDRDNRTVTILETKVPRVRFPDATAEQEKTLTDILVSNLNGQGMTISLDRLLASLDLAEHENQIADGLNNSPPKIQFVDYPAMLVTIDGEPQLRDVKGIPGGLQVVNTAFLIVLAGSDYYLYAGQGQWYSSGELKGPWQISQSVPTAVQVLAPVEEEKQAREQAEAAMQEEGENVDLGSTTPPTIIMASEPTELIVTDGKPDYKPVGVDLLYVSNSESDIFMEIATQRHFVLLSGRWFASEGLQGPWSFIAADALPASFAAIPADSDVGHVRVWVANTDEAKEAILDASIPQTAAVSRSATIQVIYDGNPRFAAIDGTSLQYATNTADQVIKDASKYYCAKDGVWYVAGQAYGPWAVATEVPDDIRKIPPSSPVYNTRYVYIYETTPEVVYVGYYPGYTSSYVYHSAIVYGTGWYYQPWLGTMYYPHPATYGFHVRWNPWYGWGYGSSYSTGRFTFGIGFGGVGHPGYWGPVGYRPYYGGYARGWHNGYRSGARAGYAAGRLDSRYRTQNVYRRNNVARTTPTARSATMQSNQLRATPNRPNDMYTDRSGNVAQRSQSGQWQQRSGAQSGWQPTQMNRDYQARQNGGARAQSYQGGGGGAARGGGGRR